MALNGAAVGPVDVKQFLADRKAGNKPPRTASVEVFLEPELAEEYDRLADEYNALIEAEQAAAKVEQSIVDGPSDIDEQLDAIEARMEAVKAEAEASKVTLTFRSYRVGDTKALNAEREARGIDAEDSEMISVLCTAVYSLEPQLSVEDVEQLAEAIGAVQMAQVFSTWNLLVFGQVTAPKLQRPLRTRATEKP